MKAMYIKDIRERDAVEGVFLVQQKTTALSKNGSAYLTMKLMDRTGEVEARIWDRVDELDRLFDRDDFIAVRGKANVYMNKMQLVVQDLSRVEDSAVNLADFLPVSSRPLAEMQQELAQKVASLEDPFVRRLLEAFLADEAFMRGFCQAPAAKSMHHVYLGGLLDHSLSVARLADEIAGHYPSINRDLLIAGALLHDIGKIRELDYARSFDYTDEGKLLGHIVLGAQMIEDKIRAIPEFPELLRTLLVHLLLSHHGQYEYGSPKRPKTLEAVVLNFLDDLDAKINGVQTHLDREAEAEGDWSSYHRLYDRYFFKAKGLKAAVAPATPEAPKTSPPPQKEAKPAERPAGRKGFGFTLADQLKGKNFDLFSEADKERR